MNKFIGLGVASLLLGSLGLTGTHALQNGNGNGNGNGLGHTNQNGNGNAPTGNNATCNPGNAYGHTGNSEGNNQTGNPGNAYGHQCTSYGYNYPYYDVDTELGGFSPLALGEDLTLDACGTSVVNANDPNDLYGLCSFTSNALDYDFTITWTVEYNGVTSTIATYSGSSTDAGASGLGAASQGTQITVSTGAGSLFASAGNYLIGLWVDMDDNDYIELPNSSWGQTGPDGIWNSADSGYLNVDFSSALLSITPTSVPEPAAALVLIPGLLLMRRRHLKRRTD